MELQGYSMQKGFDEDLCKEIIKRAYSLQIRGESSQTLRNRTRTAEDQTEIMSHILLAGPIRRAMSCWPNPSVGPCHAGSPIVS